MTESEKSSYNIPPPPVHVTRLSLTAPVEQLQDGVRQVREVLGTDIPGLTDPNIEESLWYYYFDVTKTVNYILSAFQPPPCPPTASSDPIGR